VVLLVFYYFLSVFYEGRWTTTEDMTIVLENLAGFSPGAESIAFCKEWWNLYKSGRCRADLVGK
jgi:K(+)-stimulated pyrophosphate-energized sodium pump